MEKALLNLARGGFVMVTFALAIYGFKPSQKTTSGAPMEEEDVVFQREVIDQTRDFEGMGLQTLTPIKIEPVFEPEPQYASIDLTTTVKPVPSPTWDTPGNTPEKAEMTFTFEPKVEPTPKPETPKPETPEFKYDPGFKFESGKIYDI